MHLAPSKVIRQLVLIIISLIFYSSSSLAALAQSTPLDGLIEKSHQLQISDAVSWRKLLYFNGTESEVLSEEFFFSPTGRKNPAMELEATLRAYFKPIDADSNAHPICRFPARYMWLDRQLQLPGFRSKLSSRCSYLKKWQQGMGNGSISLVLVSGFLGNPASSFGHVLMKLSPSQDSSDLTFFEKSINYGAQVPEGEGVPEYIFKGIFGFYPGRFSDEYFYTQDFVYTRTEFRDMWEYTLNLSPWQSEFLMMHSWEIRGYQFKYYFFNKNCAYRIAQLIDLVTGSDLSRIQRPWYLPEQLFLDLDEVLNEEGNSILKSIRFIPSSQRTLYAQLAQLNHSEINLVSDLFSTSQTHNPNLKKLDKLTTQDQIRVLDALIAYIKYHKVAYRGRTSIGALEQKALLKRISLAAQPPNKGGMIQLPSPETGNRSAYFGAGFYGENSQNGMVFEFGAFKRDQYTQNSLEGNELNVLNFEWINLDGSTSLQNFELIRASNLKPSLYNLAEEKRWSWRARIGAERLVSEEIPLFLNLAGGKSFGAESNFYSYALVNTYLSDESSLGGLFGLTRKDIHYNLTLESEALININGEYRNKVLLGIVVPFGSSTNWVTKLVKNEDILFKTGVNFHF